MSYQVLARKWRPQTFRELVGQTHVLKALVNALDRDQLHHAYLFTGTRGVGKTTIARILARCLNCDTGVSSEPCGTCSSCTEISEGRFVDLIEVDAASRTKVEDTRELLENVQYAPVRGRYKVYLIDEVHMLSTHSFNALLKTLEEPPPHVKFLLATTDPQKLPATVLSRCLQFHLKNMSPERIVGHLDNILSKEMINNEPQALWQIAHAAEGSMRDALSLTDQAIAFGAGAVKEAEVRDMLGSIDRSAVWKLFDALHQKDASALMEQTEQLAQLSADFSSVLEEILHCLHLIMRQQMVTGIDSAIENKEKIEALSQAFAIEQVQLYYQIALNGRRDIAYAPTSRQGVEVVLLRMLAFKPLAVDHKTAATEGALTEKKPESVVAPAEQSVTAPTYDDIPPQLETQSRSVSEALSMLDIPSVDTVVKDIPQVSPVAEPPGVQTHSAAALLDIDASDIGVSPKTSSTTVSQVHTTVDKASDSAVPRLDCEDQGQLVPVQLEQTQPLPMQWQTVFKQLAVSGVLKSVASQCELQSNNDNVWKFVLDETQSALYKEAHLSTLTEALSAGLGYSVRVIITIGSTTGNTPAALAKKLAESKHAKAMEALQEDPFVQQLINDYGGIIKPDTVSLIESSAEV